MVASLDSAYAAHFEYSRLRQFRSSRWMRPKAYTALPTEITRSLILSPSRHVNAKWPRWLVPMCASKPSAVRVSGKPNTPALFTSTSTVSTDSANVRTGQVGQIEVTHVDVACHLGRPPAR